MTDTTTAPAPAFVDLQVHSTASDGALTPAAVVQAAADAQLYAIALTDHDTVDGLDEATEAGKRLGVRIVPGVELSTHFDDDELHLLGLHLQSRDAMRDSARGSASAAHCARRKDRRDAERAQHPHHTGRGAKGGRRRCRRTSTHRARHARRWVCPRVPRSVRQVDRLGTSRLHGQGQVGCRRRHRPGTQSRRHRRLGASR
ncbi:MAG: PHP domain-containing protein [Gemmatimonas sp.]